MTLTAPPPVHDYASTAPPDDDEPLTEPPRIEALRGRLLTADQLDAIADPVPLIDGILDTDTVAELYGRPGAGKSFLALDWALCIATGKPWQGIPVTPGRVLYVLGEGLAGTKKRRQAWAQAWRHHDFSQIRWMRGAVPILDPSWADPFVELAIETQPALIVLDTLSRAISGHDENASTTMSALVTAIDRLRQAAGGACVLLVHHSTKDGVGTRGHSAFEGACDLRWRLEGDDRRLALKHEKTKDDAKAPDRALQLRVIDLGEDPRGRRITSCIVVIDRVGNDPGVPTASEITLATRLWESFGKTAAAMSTVLEATKVPTSSAYRLMQGLHAKGFVQNVGTEKIARWVLTPTGQALALPAIPTDSHVPDENGTRSLPHPPPLGVGEREEREPDARQERP